MFYGLNEKFLTVKNKSFKYVEKGNGKLVLLVHGWPENWTSWYNQISFISELGFKVVAFNTRGYSGSYIPKKIDAYSLKYYMEDILDIISFFKQDSAILIGHDWGAPICWTTAAYNKSKISAVIGLSVPFTRRGRVSNSKLWQNTYKNIFFYQNYFQKIAIPELELEKNALISLKKIYYWCSKEGHEDSVKTSKKIDSGLLDGLEMPDKNKMKWLNQKVINSLVKDFEKSGFEGSLNRYRAQEIDWQDLKKLSYLSITQPSIFIGGEYDPVRSFIKGYDSYKNAGKYCDDFKGAFILKNCGHWVQQEKPNQVNKIIGNFLSTLF